MKTLLVLNSSGRSQRSITRQLTSRFSRVWQAREPEGRVVMRDLTAQPPPVVNESWIAAAFADPAQRTARDHDALRVSESLIDELASASAVVIGAPVYNFGMPAQLKAYLDQIIRVGRTFSFDSGAADPYRPLLAERPVVVITSAGDGALLAGGALAHLNHLEPHLRTALGFIGLRDPMFIRVGYEEFGDDRFRHALGEAQAEVDRLAVRLVDALRSEPLDPTPAR